MRSISTGNNVFFQRGLTGLLLGLFLVPTLFVLYQALATENFSPLFSMATTVLPGYLGNTVLLSLFTILLALLFGVVSAFLVAFFSFPGQRLLDVALVLPLVLPSYLVAIVYRESFHDQFASSAMESVWGASLVLALTLYPYIYLLARTAFQQQAMGYIEIGKSLGLNRRQIASRALIPLAMPSILLGVLLVMVEVISDFGTASILGIRTLTTAVHRIWFEMYDTSLAAQVALVSALFPLMLILLYALMTRGKGFINPSNRPRPPQLSALQGTARWLAFFFCLLPVLFGFLLPMLRLLLWAAEAFGRFNLQSLYQDLLQTLGLSLGTVLVTLLFGLWLALIGRWAKNRGWTLASLSIISLNYAMPAIVLAIAMLILTASVYDTSVGSWLSNSMLLVLIATVLRFTSFSYFSIESGLQGISQRVDEAVSCVGRNRVTTVLRVLLPMLRGALVVGGLLVFVIAAKELTLSLVLQPFGFRTLALSIYYFADIELFEPAAVYALCLVLLVIYPVLSINRWLSSR